MAEAPTASPTRARKAVRSAAFVLAAYLALTLGMTYPVVRHFFSAIPGDGFDGWQNFWNLWWVRRALLVEHRHPFFTDMLYHPTGVSLLFHTLNPFNGFTFLPMQLAGELFAAYNSVVLFSFAVGGLGGYLLTQYALRRVPEPARTWAAFLAGAIYTFSPFHFAHLLGHMQVLSLEWIPFYVLYLCRGMDRAQRGPIAARDVIMPVVFLVLISLCDWYFVLYCVLFTGLVWLYLLWRRRLSLRIASWTLAVGLLFAIVMSPLLWPMIVEASRYDFMVPDPDQVYMLSADLLAFFTPNEFHPLWGDIAARVGRLFTSPVSEHTVFAGYVPLLLALWGVRTRGRTARFWALAALSFALLAMGPALHIAGRRWPIPLPYAILQRVIPFIQITRSVSRLDVMVMLSLGVLAAYGLQALMSAGQRPQWIALGALALTLFEFLPVPYPVSPPDTPAWYETLARESGDFAVLNLPMNWDRPGYLLYQTVHGKRLTVAYISRDDPRTLTERVPVLQQLRHLGPDVIAQDLERVGRSVLSYLDVRYVILDRYKMPGEQEREPTVRYATAALSGLAPIYEDERLIVYRVEPPEHQTPFLILGDGWGPRRLEGGAPWRRIAGRATLQVYVAEPADLILRMTARSEAPETALTLRISERELRTVSLDPTPRDLEIGPLKLSEGLHTFTLSTDGPIWLTGLDVIQ
ncbi:MAG TPA: hypothetical protein G4O02_16030 [Caldilineae bacterium]|nr:hypothetical protein [Caldilineae bacterium]